MAAHIFVVKGRFDQQDPGIGLVADQILDQIHRRRVKAQHQPVRFELLDFRLQNPPCPAFGPAGTRRAEGRNGVLESRAVESTGWCLIDPGGDRGSSQTRPIPDPAGRSGS